ncbi:putative 60S ribosomal protein L23 [Paratrimastix pyriformis]|uniref:60S ribosomal protein L23 n=1 Tax=Paratrimastix pyriformis TaxID=342808 RepID=A0ABQ8UN69_9EUKA|nr:putative 60S ribosomal protein L23 [Paratrimastix pyriformis]
MATPPHVAVARAAYTWGLNSRHSLGLGASSAPKIFVPAKVTGLAARAGPYVDVSTGGFFSMALSQSGQIWSWGSGKCGRLGTGNEDDTVVPVQIRGFGTSHPVQISCGDWHAGCVCDDGKAFVWGYNCAVGCSANSLVPRQVDLPEGVRALQISCGERCTGIVTSDGRIFTFANGSTILLGHPADAPGIETSRPTPIAFFDGAAHAAVKVVMSFQHAAAVDREGNLYMWGSCADGALAVPASTRVIHTPQLVQIPPEDAAVAGGPAAGNQTGVRVVDVALSKAPRWLHTAVCDDQGRMWVWGSNYKGKLGLSAKWSHGDEDQHTHVPSLVTHFMEQQRRVVSVASGGIYSAAMDEQGGVWTWGCGSDGRLGHPEAEGHRYLSREGFPPQAIRVNKFRITMGLPVGACINCADNTGAKSLCVISVKGVQGRLNRLPHAAVGDMVMCSVKKGKPELRKKVLPCIIVRQRKPWRRREGLYIYFEDNAGVIVNPKGEMKGSQINGPVAKECAELWPRIASNADTIV